MNDEQIKKVIDELTGIQLMEKEKIPDIDLYMDQIITIFEDSLKDYKRNDDDKILTKTMINNYVKDKIISPPIRKKYSKKHIISLTIIYHLKSILSISDIGKLLSGIDENLVLYDGFLKLQQFENESVAKEIMDRKNIISEFAPKELEDLLFILMLVVKANNMKRIAEKLIDEYTGASKA